MLSSNELAAMQDVQEQTMTETVYIQRLTRTADGTGGWSEAWNTIGTVKGRIVAKRADEPAIGGRAASYTEYVVTLPHDTALLQTDRLQINSVQYEVKGILERSEKTALRVICVKLG